MEGRGVTQNTSTAVMQRRHEAHDSLDFFPTPAWATRALCEWIITTRRRGELSDLTAWDPACGEHDMARPLGEYFKAVIASDIAPYSGGHLVEDFLWPTDSRADWIITNPPFRLADQFARTAIERSSRGAALLVRSAFLEGIARLSDLFEPYPPSDILQFSERLPMVKGRVDREASSATAYCWVVWRKRAPTGTHFRWLAPCRKRLERDSDYPAASEAA
jgi:hypothetical protein